MISFGLFSAKQDKADLKEQNLLLIHSVIDNPIDKTTGKYTYFELENGEKIEASMKNIEEYKLEYNVNKVNPSAGEPSFNSMHISLKRLTDWKE